MNDKGDEWQYDKLKNIETKTSREIVRYMANESE